MSDRPLLLGIDDGTSGVKVVAYDLDLRPVASASRPVPVTHPRPGWVEQDPERVLESVIDAVATVLDDALGTVVACGIDHQGESVLAWDAVDGRPLSPIIVWQDKRSATLLDSLGDALTTEVVARSGLPLDPYFSAGKLAWILREGDLPSAADVRMGTVDAFLSDRLGGGYATDPSTASRTQLSGIVGTGAPGWDPRLLDIFGVPADRLPPIVDSVGELGALRHPRWRQELPLRARLVDQQAALAGTGGVRPGQAKATYGTGVFVLAHTGMGVPPREAATQGLLPTVAWSIAGTPSYALEGGVFSAGALVRWLSDELGLAADAASLLDLARTVADAGGVRVLPALSGLGAPWWRPRAQAVIAGIGPDSTRGHIARAALESIAWRVGDIVAEVERVVPISVLRMDGGLGGDPLLAQLQADVLGLAVERMDPNGTSRGTAALAAVGAGIWSSTDEIEARIRPIDRTEPRRDAVRRSEERASWVRFVERAAAILDRPAGEASTTTSRDIVPRPM